MHVILTFLIIVLTLIVIIGCHELGHAVVARFFGVKIECISIGFGKPLLSWRTRHGVRWVWSMWPLGGYVKLLNTRISTVSDAERPYCFDQKSIWVRCIIISAGSFFNLVLAFILLTLATMTEQRQLAPVIGEVMPRSIAAQAGLEPGDRIDRIQNVTVNNWYEVSQQLLTSIGQQSVQIALSGKTSRTVVFDLSKISWDKPVNSFLGYFGFQPDVRLVNEIVVKPLGLLGGVSKAVKTLNQSFLFVISVFKLLLIGAIPLTLLIGPLAFFDNVSTVFHAGIVPFLQFLALLSFLTGLVNLLPLPGLDGAALVYAGIEKYRKRPMSQALEILLYRLAMIVFALLLVQLILNDLQKWLAEWVMRVSL